MTTPPGPESTAMHPRNPRGLRLFLDEADPREWQRLLPLGIFWGVTTNPLLLARSGRPCTPAALRELAVIAGGFGAREIHLQTWGKDAADMVRVGQELAGGMKTAPRILVKVPATAAGLEAAAALRALGLPVTLTAVYQEGQVIAAAGLGADYAAPYLGRLLDAGRDGMRIVCRMQEILTATGSATRLLAASLRSVAQVCDLAARGLDTFTLGPAVARALVADELTELAARAFQTAAAQGAADPGQTKTDL